MCRVNRYEKKGFCGEGAEITAAKAYLHKWEEPCVSGKNGSGTVFFSGCNLKCVFCQNYEISSSGKGKVITSERLSEIFLELQDKGAMNINLVTPTHFVPQIIDAVKKARKNGLKIPTVYNSSGYERIETLKMLEGVIDVYLPDMKYFSSKYSMKYSNAPDYFDVTSKAVLEMYRQVGEPVFDENGIIKKGLMIRHLMLPGLLFDSKKIVDWVSGNLPKGVYLNIMCQYIPMNNAYKYPEINRKLNEKHYEALLDYAAVRGIENGYFQEYDSASGKYVPDFNNEGI